MEREIALPEETKEHRRKGKLPPAPRHLFGIPNPDKMHEDPPYSEYDVDESLARFPGPFRGCIIGRVNSGKSLIAKHILMAHQAHNPKFEELYIVHGMADTKEYDDCEPTEIMTEIPDVEGFDPDIKKLIIIDDYDFTKITRAQDKRLSELFRFGSSHKNISVLLLHQSWFRVPKIAKDLCSVFIVFRPVDLDELATLGRRVGLKKEEIKHVFQTHMPHFRDSLGINLIPGAPHKFVKNLYEPLELDFNNV